MRKLLLAVCLIVGVGSAEAQIKTAPSLVRVRAGGDFTKTGAVDTALQNYETPTGIVLVTALDTVQTAAGAGDSARIKIIGAVNSITFETHAWVYTGTNCDSVTVQYWATCAPGNGDGSYMRMQSTTLNSGTQEQVIQWQPTNGIGNPFTNQRVSVDVADLAGTCKVRYKTYVLIR